MMAAHKTNRRQAFTLLEVILALALGSIIIFTIGMAIDIHYQAIRVSRVQIEEAQLARALMARVAEDLRAAVQSDAKPADSSADTSTAAKSASADTGTAAGADASKPPAGSDSTTDTTSSSSTSSSTTATSPPGLYGDSAQLQVDISRLPRLDRLQTAQSDAQPSEPAGDIRTVAWYLTSSMATAVGSQPTSGLMRRELDHSVAAWAAANGTIDDQGAQSLAEEVVNLEFRYYDGSSWSDTWDTTQQGGLPTAVEVSLTLQRTAENRGLGSQVLGFSNNPSNAATYRMVVFLPGAHAASSSADSQASASTSKAAGSSSTDTSSSGGSGGKPSGGTPSGSGGSRQQNPSGGNPSGGGPSGRNPPMPSPNPPSPGPAAPGPSPGPSDPNQDPNRAGAS